MYKIAMIETCFTHILGDIFRGMYLFKDVYIRRHWCKCACMCLKLVYELLLFIGLILKIICLLDREKLLLY